MQAAIYRRYGSPEVIHIEEIENPQVEDNEVLVKVHSASINPYDCHHRKGFFPVRLMTGGFFKPKSNQLGVDVAGTIEKIGSKVKRLKVGDDVFGFVRGSCAEYVSADEKLLSIKPSNLSFNETAALPCAAVTALQALRGKANLKKGSKILIYGASGGIGHLAVQIAKHFEAEVTAVCSTDNVEWVKNLGADTCIDYKKEDFTSLNKSYDIIFDAVAKTTFFQCKSSLTETGTYITVNPISTVRQPFQLLINSLIGKQKAASLMAKPLTKDLDLIAKLTEVGKLVPTIESTYSLAQLPKAHRHCETGRTKGKIVIEICAHT